MSPAASKRGRLKAAVLISGTGSNLKALISAIASGNLELDITRVVSNRKQAGGIEHARAAGIPVSIIRHGDFSSRQAHDNAIIEVLKKDDTEIIILAGYMRILGESFTTGFSGRTINLHPSLLPLYKGLDTYERALKAGDHETGASIHIVTAGLDAGPVISQVRFAIEVNDDVDSLREKLGPLEHKLLVATVDQFCKRKLHVMAGMVMLEGRQLEKPLQMNHDGTLK